LVAVNHRQLCGSIGCFRFWPIPEIDIKPPLPPAAKFAEFTPDGFSESGHELASVLG
jgi:hypothetical protein